MGWIVALAILLAIGFIPIGVNVTFNENGGSASLLAGPIRVSLFRRAKKRKAKNPQVVKSTSAPKKDQGGDYKDFVPLLHLLLDLLAELKRRILVNNLYFRLILACDDPSDLAIHYGQAWAALGNLMPQLERIFTIKKRDLEVECDFAAEKTVVVFRMDITITVARLLHLGFLHGIKIIKEYFRVMNKRKGGAGV